MIVVKPLGVNWSPVISCVTFSELLTFLCHDFLVCKFGIIKVPIFRLL